VTKIKNCSGFPKVDRILKVWSLLSSKIKISSKSVELKRSTAQTPATPPVHNHPPLKHFFKAKIYWKFGNFCKACIVAFQKSNICHNKLLKTSELLRKIHFHSLNFQQISALEPNLAMKFPKFDGGFSIIQSQLIRFQRAFEAILLQNPSTGTGDIFNWISKKWK
jgi:hypothetical protein